MQRLSYELGSSARAFCSNRKTVFHAPVGHVFCSSLRLVAIALWSPTASRSEAKSVELTLRSDQSRCGVSYSTLLAAIAELRLLVAPIFIAVVAVLISSSTLNHCACSFVV